MKKMNSATHSFARLFFVLSAVAGLLLAAGGRGAFAQSPSKSGFVYNGIVYGEWSPDGYQETPQAQNAVAAIAATNASYTSVITTWYVPDITSTDIAPVSTLTPTDDALVAAIQSLQSQGIKVFLKPHVQLSRWILEGHFRTNGRGYLVRQLPDVHSPLCGNRPAEQCSTASSSAPNTGLSADRRIGRTGLASSLRSGRSTVASSLTAPTRPARVTNSLTSRSGTCSICWAWMGTFPLPSKTIQQSPNWCPHGPIAPRTPDTTTWRL